MASIDNSLDFSPGHVAMESGSPSTRIVLRDWTAWDFSNAYTRFKPQLISHATRILRDSSRAEEIVQDAFLYLMTSLPELDSELGVLRFLKWKTRMLCIDSLRAVDKSIDGHSIPMPEEISLDSDLSEDIARADELGIVSLALARLPQQQRDALIASVYMEKTTEDLATQLGLSSNATRQLLYRARKSFKSALIGEADVAGKTISEILVLAARKNRSRAGGALAMLALIVSVVNLPIIDADFTNETSLSRAESFSEAPVSVQSTAPLAANEETDSARAGDPDSPPISIEGSLEPNVFLGEVTPTLFANDAVLDEENVTTAMLRSRSDNESADGLQSDFNELSLARKQFSSMLDISLASQLAGNVDAGQLIHRDGRTIVFTSENGVRAFVALADDSESLVQHFSLIFETNSGLVSVVPSNSIVSVERNADGGSYVEYVATDLLFGDLSGQFENVTVEDADIRRSGFVARLWIDSSGELLDGSVSVIPRS